MLEGFGYPLKRSADGITVSLEGGHQLKATTIDVPSDISSATFFLIAAAICPGSDVLLEHVGINPTRIGVINILKLMGADIQVLNPRSVGGEPVAELAIKYAPLNGITIPESQIPLAIDEFPALFIAAAVAEGDTILRGAEELRVKESDRLAAMAAGLTLIGVKSEMYADGIRISGDPQACFTAAEIDSQGDHRIAMAFAVASLRAAGPLRILDCANVATSFPNFVELSAELGLEIGVE
jgi:3-phosphoshikimate 1-carboxyvinyltransferase